MPDLSAPVWLVGYIVHDIQHGEFTKSRKREPEVRNPSEPTFKEVFYNYTVRSSLKSFGLRELGKASRSPCSR